MHFCTYAQLSVAEGFYPLAPLETMLFFATSMEKSISGKFDFGNKLRSSQSLNFKMQLPTQNQQPNYAVMEILISAIQKLVIKDVVLYADKKIASTKSVK